MRSTSISKLDKQFIERWSPRAFISDPLSKEEIDALFEAARWSPSCYNAQPWRFVFSQTVNDLEKFQSLLVEQNRSWANKAPLLIILFAKNKFDHNGKENNWSEFDCGAAWMALSLQARKLGLYAHAMAGFNQDDAYQITGLSKNEYRAMCIIAVGKKGDPESLPKELQNIEGPNKRKPLKDIVYNQADQ